MYPNATIIVQQKPQQQQGYVTRQVVAGGDGCCGCETQQYRGGYQANPRCCCCENNNGCRRDVCVVTLLLVSSICVLVGVAIFGNVVSSTNQKGAANIWMTITPSSCNTTILANYYNLNTNNNNTADISFYTNPWNVYGSNSLCPQAGIYTFCTSHCRRRLDSELVSSSPPDTMLGRVLKAGSSSSSSSSSSNKPSYSNGYNGCIDFAGEDSMWSLWDAQNAVRGLNTNLKGDVSVLGGKLYYIMIAAGTLIWIAAVSLFCIPPAMLAPFSLYIAALITFQKTDFTKSTSYQYSLFHGACGQVVVSYGPAYNSTIAVIVLCGILTVIPVAFGVYRWTYANHTITILKALGNIYNRPYEQELQQGYQPHSNPAIQEGHM